MKTNYIQLPPLPSNMPLKSIEIIWLYARLPQMEQETLRDFIKESLKEDGLEEEGKAMWDSNAQVSPEVLEYTNLFRELVVALIVQACEMAALVYREYCTQGKSVEEISKEHKVDEETIRLVAQYYEERNGCR